MKKVLLLNGGKKFAHSDGRYNTTLHEAALSVVSLEDLISCAVAHEA